MFLRLAQRVRNRQPLGGASGDGGSPSSRATHALPRVEGKLRDRGKQCARVGMPRVGANLLGGPALDDLAQEHHSDSRAELADDPQVVADEHQREIESLLEVVAAG